MKPARTWIAALVAYSACGAPAAVTPPPPRAQPVTALRVVDGAIERDAGLDAIIGDAQIIGLGEAVHAVGGFTTARAQLTRYLVEHHGARLVLIEAPFAAFAPANAFVTHGTGRAEAALDGLYLNLRSQQMLAFIAWLRDYNARNPHAQVQLRGFDIMGVPLELAAVTDAATQRSLALDLDGCFLPRTREELIAFQRARQRRELVITREDAERCLTPLRALEPAFADAPALRVSLGNLTAWIDLVVAASRDGRAGADGVREPALAANVRRLHALFGQGGRTIVWAHNVHVMKDKSRITTERPMLPAARYMGGFLAADATTPYRAIGVSALRVHVAQPGADAAAFTAPEDTLEAHVMRSGHGAKLVDLRVPPSWREPIAFSTVWAGDNSEDDMVGPLVGYPRDLFDAMVILDEAVAPEPVVR